jgi:hypothetical protein
VTGAEFDERGEVDIDLLADYIGGALSGTPDESVVATLITDDPAWRDAYDELSGGMAAVGAELARLAPEPMPADLAARLDILLTTPTPAEFTRPAQLHGENAQPAQLHGENAQPAEVPAEIAQPAQVPAEVAQPGPIPADLVAPSVPHLAVVRDPDAGGDGAHGVPDGKSPQRERRTRPRPARRLRWATPIAIAAGMVALGGFGADYLAGRDHGAKDAATSAGVAQTQAQDDAGSVPKAAAGMQVLDSGADYTATTLADPPDAQFRRSSSDAAAPDSGVGGPTQAPNRPLGAADPLSRLRPQAALQLCLDAIQEANSGGPIVVRTVDYAQFNGAPAVVVRFSAPNGSWAWASGPACGTPSGGANTLASVPVR